MNSLRERLREIERNPSPDLWDEIASRTGPSYVKDRRGLRHRIAAGLVAAVVSLAALAFLVTMFRTEPDQGGVGTAPSPLTIRVRTTNDPFDVRFSATFQGQEIELVGIETPGPELEYPNSTSAILPAGTPIAIEASEGISVSVFELDPAQGKFVVEDGSCLIPGSLRALPGPDETAFFIYAEGKGWSGGQAFRAETGGEELDHDSALDPNSKVDASTLGLASCDTDPSQIDPSRVQVPSLEGLTLNEAKTVLSKVGLDIAPVYLANDSVESGKVTSLEPEPGSRVLASTSVIAYISSGPDNGGFAWAGSIVKQNPDVFLGSYRGPDGFPVLAAGPDADLADWRATLDPTHEGTFALVPCPVGPDRLRKIESDVRTLVEGGAIEGGIGFGLDPRTCSVQVEGSFSPPELQLLRDRFGDLVTIVDGIKIAALGDL
jgi:hypothetical protein